MYEELEKHRIAIAKWFNANGHNAYPNANAYNNYDGYTLKVNGHQIWHEKHEGWVSWFCDQCTDHSVRLDWNFRISADFPLTDGDWRKQAQYILKIIEMDDKWSEFQDNFIPVGQ